MDTTSITEAGDKLILVLGMLVGFFVLPPVAKAAPKVVNGFLLLILLGILLFNANTWLPVFQRFAEAVPSSGDGSGGGSNKKKR